MKLTQFAQRFGKKTGIGELMDDMGKAMQGRENMRMLGGGNPAHIPEINAIWRKRTESILKNGTEFEAALANYDTPRGKHDFLESLAALINREFQWNLTADNIAITNGSQTAFFILFNMICGRDEGGRMNRIMFPLCPEYIGYADQTLDPDACVSVPAAITETHTNFFKYHVDFEALNLNSNIAALCVSRPTNPTGNVLTDDEITHLAQLAEQNDIPLIIDNAYGAPFPHIIFQDVKPYWDRHVILGMSLSKLGLPSVRTGIVIAAEDIIESLAACNAVLSLSSGSFGQVLLKPLIDSGEILSLSKKIIQPFYQQRCEAAVQAIQETFGNDFPYRIHEPEGAFFLWLWFPGLPISSKELYERLKKRGVLVVSGHYFFYGLDKNWPHAHECLRLSYAQDQVKFREAVAIIADEVRQLQ